MDTKGLLRVHLAFILPKFAKFFPVVEVAKRPKVISAARTMNSIDRSHETDKGHESQGQIGKQERQKRPRKGQEKHSDTQAHAPRQPALNFLKRRHRVS